MKYLKIYYLSIYAINLDLNFWEVLIDFLDNMI